MSGMGQYRTSQGLLSSAECEGVGLHAGIDELDLERAVSDGAILAHELVLAKNPQPLTQNLL
jgi:hypothetical protein